MERQPWTSRTRRWQSNRTLWIFWILLGLLLLIGFTLISGSPGLIHLIQATPGTAMSL